MHARAWGAGITLNNARNDDQEKNMKDMKKKIIQSRHTFITAKQFWCRSAVMVCATSSVSLFLGSAPIGRHASGTWASTGTRTATARNRRASRQKKGADNQS